MARKKKIFCRCGQEVTISKPKKGHRTFVCPKCGIIATNPLPLLLAAAAPAITSALTAAAPSLIEGAVTHFTTPKEAAPRSPLPEKDHLSPFEKVMLIDDMEKRKK